MVAFPSSPAPGEAFGRWQWDGIRWVPRGSVGPWETTDAPADAVYGRREGEWRHLNRFEHVLTLRQPNNLNIPAGVWLLIWDTVDLDTQGGWNNATKRYTPNVPGLYLFQCLTPAVQYIAITKNVDVFTYDAALAVSNMEWYHTYTVISAMNGTSDYVSTWTHISVGGTIAPGTARTEFSAYRLPSW